MIAKAQNPVLSPAIDKKKFVETVGRRKTAVARVRLYPSEDWLFSVNNQNLNTYFKTDEQRRVAQEAFEKTALPQKFTISAKIGGGGLSGQAGALRHAIARALVLFDDQSKKKLKKAGFLKRDPRAKERRKFGLKKARKAPQWAKR